MELLIRIPKGQVTTYGVIGDALGIHPRQVGRLLHQNQNPERFPCHRVVKSDGSLAGGYAFGGQSAQKKKLEEEGIRFNREKIHSFRKKLYPLKSN